MMRKAAAVVAALLVASAAGRSFAAADFDNLTLGAESYWNGSDRSGGFATGNVAFNNHYFVDPVYLMEFWGGWAYSNTTDTTTGDYTNQYSAIPGAGQSGDNYGVAYYDTYTPTVPTLTLAAPEALKHAYFTNTTYAYLVMRDGDPYGYAKKFGGATGNDADWFLLTVTGKDAGGAATGTVEFYLADYRFADPAQDYLVDTWTKVDLSALGTVRTVEFALSSSDSGPWGINTPTYFALDTLAVAPEPASLAFVAAGLSGLLAARRRR